MIRCPHCGETFVYDPTGLVASKEPLAPVPELARLLDCSARDLKKLLKKEMYKDVRFLRPISGPWLYCVADARTAIEPHREALAARRQANEAKELAARAAKAAKPPKPPAPPPDKRVGPPVSMRRTREKS